MIATTWLKDSALRNPGRTKSMYKLLINDLILVPNRKIIFFKYFSLFPHLMILWIVYN
jgi:hypothetical protein